MTSIATTQNQGFGVADLLAQLRNASARRKLRRDTRLALAELSERGLEDIGLNRADIDTVLARL